MGFPSSLLRGAVVALALASLSGCGEKLANAQTGGGAPPPPAVSIVTVEAQPVVVTDELPGRLEASRIAEVRARVPGIVLDRAFREGSDVKKGQLLFKIDPAPYKAAFQSAEAAVAKAQANVTQAKVKVERYKPLVETNAISKQEFDEAVADEKQAVADVAAAKAARETARINLSYASVTAPISGRIGRAQVTEGALVGQGTATPLATIQQLDPIYVNITQSANEALALQRAMRDGQLKKSGKEGARVTIVMQDGEPYPHAGKLLFSDLTVDPDTGAIMLRALVPNPDNFLLPGMYVRARVEHAVRDNAIAVPQQAVQRTPKGAMVMVVDKENKVTPRPVKADSSRGDQWIITEGLKPGDRVMVEGFQKAPPGAVVNPVPWKKEEGASAAVASASTDAPSAGETQKQAPKK